MRWQVIPAFVIDIIFEIARNHMLPRKKIIIADKKGTINSTGTYSRVADTTINIQLANQNLHTEKVEMIQQ